MRRPGKGHYRRSLWLLLFLLPVLLLTPVPLQAQGGACPINLFLGGRELHTEGPDGDKVYVVCVDLTNPNFRFQTVMANDILNVNARSDQRETVTAMAGRAPYTVHNPILAINADYFGSGHGAEGLTVVNGFRVDGPGAPSYDGDNNEVNRASLAVSRLNAIEIGHKGAAEVANNVVQLSRFYNAVGGGPTLVGNGQVIPNPCLVLGENVTAYNCSKTQQTAVGVSQDGQTLIIVVAESKTGEEMGQILQRYGAYTGMKFDGGGSSQLWFEGNLVYHDPGEGAQGREVADALLIFRETIPRHNAFILSQSEFPIVAPGETVDLSFTLRNTGFLPWEQELPYAIRFVGGDQLGLSDFYGLGGDVPPNGDLAWSQTVTAPQEPGAYQMRWQMTYEDGGGRMETIGPEIGYLITVLPEGSTPDLGDAIRQIIDEAQRQAEESLDAFLNRLEREIERRIQEELRKITICGQPIFGLILLGLVLGRRQRRGRDEHDG